MKLFFVLLMTVFSFNSMAQLADTHRYDCRIFAGNYEHYSYGSSVDHVYKAVSNQSQMITLREKLSTTPVYPSTIEEGEVEFRYTIMGNHDFRLQLNQFRFELNLRHIPNAERQNWVLSKNIPNIQSDLHEVSFVVVDPSYNRRPMINFKIPAGQEYFHFPVVYEMGKVNLPNEFYNHQFSFQVECMKPGLMTFPAN